MPRRARASVRRRTLVATLALAVLVVSLAACGGSDGASRSGSKDAVDRQAGFLTRDVEMLFRNYSDAELWIDWRGKDGQQEPSWETPLARRWAKNWSDYIYDFPVRIILSNDGVTKTWVEVDTANPIGADPSVTVAGRKWEFVEDEEMTFSGPGWKLEVKREVDDDYIVFEAKFFRI